jgi:hypothetical protein
MNPEKLRVEHRSTRERLEKFYERLGAAPASSSRSEALALIVRVLNEVEDEMSGIPYNPEVYEDRSAPTDGRMYPPLEDAAREVPGHPGVTRYRTRGHNIFISETGAIEIQDIRTQDTVFKKADSIGDCIRKETS